MDKAAAFAVLREHMGAFGYRSARAFAREHVLVSPAYQSEWNNTTEGANELRRVYDAALVVGFVEEEDDDDDDDPAAMARAEYVRTLCRWYLTAPCGNQTATHLCYRGSGLSVEAPWTRVNAVLSGCSSTQRVSAVLASESLYDDLSLLYEQYRTFSGRQLRRR